MVNFRKILGIAALLLIGLVPLVSCGPAALPGADSDDSIDLIPLDPEPTRDPNATEQPTKTPKPPGYVKPTDLPTTTPFPTLPPNPISPPRGASSEEQTISQKLVQFISENRSTFDGVARVKVLSHRTHVVPNNVVWPNPKDPPYISPELEYRTYTRTKLKLISTVQGTPFPATFELVALSRWPNIALKLNTEYILFLRQQFGAIGDFDGHPSKVEYNAKQLKAFGGKASHLMGHQVWIIDGTVARWVPLDHHQSTVAADSLVAARDEGESMSITQLTATYHPNYYGTARLYHDLAMPDAISHWDDGEMTYKFSGAFPRSWNGYTHQAAAHLERETFATGVNYNVKSTNQIAIEE